MWDKLLFFFKEDLEASHKISMHDKFLSWVGSMIWKKWQKQIQEIQQNKIQFSLMRSCRRESCSHMAETAPTLFVPPENWFPCCQLPPAAFSLLAPSGALIAIPTYYWPSATHPTFSDLACVPLYNTDFHFLSHYSYIKSNHWTHLLATCIPYWYNRTSLMTPFWLHSGYILATFWQHFS